MSKPVSPVIGMSVCTVCRWFPVRYHRGGLVPFHPMPHTIRRATDSDVAGCADTMVRAFAADPVMRFLLPDDETYAQLGPPLCRNVLRRSLAVDGLWCRADRAAFAAWEPPARSPSAEPQLEWFDPNRLDLDRFAALRTVVQAHRPNDRHWYLQVLGTDPAMQANGFGAALMQQVFPHADRSAIPCYLETETRRLVSYYQRHGFEVRTHWQVPGGGPRMWGMLRPPGGRAVQGVAVDASAT